MHLILEFFEFIYKFRRQNIIPGAQKLAELDKAWTEPLHTEADYPGRWEFSLSSIPVFFGNAKYLGRNLGNTAGHIPDPIPDCDVEDAHKPPKQLNV
ncbi:hypothetical protein JCM12294_38190 [Desulfocicer niacini]